MQVKNIQFVEPKEFTFSEKFTNKTVSKVNANNPINSKSIFTSSETYPMQITKQSNLNCKLVKPSTTLFKGVKDFLNKDLEEKLGDISSEKPWIRRKYPNEPIWYASSPHLALSYAYIYNGSVNVYKTQKQLALIDLHDIKNQETIFNNLINSLNYLPYAKKKEILTYFKVKTGYNITEKERYEQIIRYKKYDDNVLWVYDTIGSKPGIFKNDTISDEIEFFGLGGLDRLLYKEISKLYHRKVNGIISPQHKTKLAYAGIMAEEIALFNNPSMLKRYPSSIYDVSNWTGIILSSNYLYDARYFEKNQNMQVYNFYLNVRNEYSNWTSPSDKLIYAQNVHSFNSINLLDDKEDSIKLLSNVSSVLNAKFIFLTEFTFNTMHRDDWKGFVNDNQFRAVIWTPYNSAAGRNSFGQILLSKYNILYKEIVSISNERKAIIVKVDNTTYAFTHLSIGKRLHDPNLNMFQVFNNSKFNILIRIKELNAIIEKNPDFIIGDFNFSIDDFEMNFLTEKGYTPIDDLKATVPFPGKVVDMIFKKNELVTDFKVSNVPFYLSDHYGITM